MIKWLCVLGAVAIAFAFAVGPAQASVVTVTTTRTVEVGQNLFDFFGALITDMDGAGYFYLGGDKAKADALGVTKEFKIAEHVTLRGALGLTDSVGGEQKHQPIAAATATALSVKGWQLEAGIALCSGDISSDYVDLGGPIRLHYVGTLALTKLL